MITDTYLSYNDSEFGSTSQTGKFYNSTSNKPPLPTISYDMSDQQQSTKYNLNESSLNGYNYGIRRAYTEESIIEILRGKH